MAASPSSTAPRNASGFSLRLLGTPQLTGPGGGSLPGLGPGKPLALLAYLAVRGEVRRDELVELLWGGIDEGRARNAFRQALHRLRGGLGEDAVGGARDTVRLELGDRLWCDRDDFLAAITRGDPFVAVQLYAGDFLDGFELGEPSFDLWADAERTRLRDRMHWALREATNTALQEGRGSEAIRHVERLREMLPYDEDAGLLHASTLVAAGRSPEAIIALERLERRLSEDLGIRPSSAVTDTLARLQRTRRPTPPSSTAAAGPALRPPFVGREAEVGILLAAVRDLEEERGSTVVVEGTSGIGKSRLVEEALARARALGRLLVLHGRERPASAVVPYAGIAEALRGVLRAPGIAGASQHLLAEAARILPELRDSIDLPVPPPIEDDASRLRFYEGVAALLDAVAYELPIALFLDDAHHAPAATLDLLAYLSGRLRTSPVLLIAAARTDHPGTAKLLEALEGSRRIVLAGFPPEECAAIVRAVAGERRDGSIPEESIAAASGGHPMRVLELTRAAMRGEPVRPAPVPLRDLLYARLTGCAPSQRRVFFASALIGRAAPVRVLAAAAHLPEPAALDAVGLLEDLGLLEQQGEGFALAHEESAALVHDLAGSAGRSLLAGWAADALAEEPESSHAELAALYAAAARPVEAFTSARAAAFDAARLGARVEASRCLSMALAFAPDDESRTEIESLLRALGDPQIALPLALPPGDRAAREYPANPSEERATEAPRADPSPRPAPAARATTKTWWSLVLAHPVPFGGVLVAALLIGAWWAVRREAAANRPFATGPDSIVVVERGRERLAGAVLAVNGEVVGQSERVAGPAWTDSLALPWINPLPSPDGSLVAVERMGDAGTDLFVIPASRRDTIAVAQGGGDDIALGWSPDGTRLLVSRGRALSPRAFTSDLWAFRIRGGGAPIALDTASSRSVTEAAWSPDGSHVAWVARVGNERQQEVYLALASGEQRVNVSRSAAEDYHIAWSPDGGLLAFTSERTGNPELFAAEPSADRLWQLTRDPASDDRALFSPDGRSVAFESTRGGVRSVYAMPALGGSPRRLTPDGVSYSLLRWQGRGAPFIDRVRIIGGRTMQAGDSLALGALLVDQRGAADASASVRWALLDTGVAQLFPSPVDGGRSAILRAGRDGTVRILAEVPGWRSDTVEIQVGRAALGALAESFEGPIDASRWELLGAPLPGTGVLDGVVTLLPRADLSWESGALSTARIPLRSGLSLSVRLVAPFTSTVANAATLTAAFVAEPEGSIARTAPRLQPLAAVTWMAESQRLVYAVDRELWSESVGATAGSPTQREVNIAIDSVGRAEFYVGGVRRWRSSLPVLGSGSADRARVWLGGRATFDQAGFADLRVRVDRR